MLTTYYEFRIFPMEMNGSDTHMCAYPHTLKHTHTLTLSHTRSHTHTHTHAHTLTLTKNTYTHAQAHTHIINARKRHILTHRVIAIHTILYIKYDLINVL